MKQKNFRLVWLIIAVIMLAFVPKEVRAQEEGTCDFTVTTGDDGEYSFADNKLTVKTGTVTVSTSAQTSQTIVLEGTTKLILAGVNISTSAAPPIEVVEGSNAVIELAENTKNILESTAKIYAGIHVPVGSKVTFTGSGELETKASTSYINSSCAIGGQQSGNTPYSCGTVIFDLDGKITAQGGRRAAGIGTCMKENEKDNEKATIFGSIIIKNGIIEAKGETYAAGIGTGPDGVAGGCVNILIEGGTVTASNDKYNIASGIGNGVNSKAVMYITVTGGEINGSIGKGTNAKSLEQVIVGPDAKVSGNISGYANGIVFSGDPKAATMKGDVIIPADVTLTIDANETLTIPAGQTLTIEDGGAIINNGGTITYSGTIKYERAGLTIGNYGTICLPYAVAEKSGAEFFSIAGKKIEDGKVTWLVLKEVEGDLEAGKPYIFKATADKLSCTYSMNNAVESPGKDNGLIGSFTQMEVSEDYYVLKDNVIYKCSAEKTWNIAANRAYINMGDVSEYNPDAPSSANHVVKMRVSGGTTGIDAVRTEQQGGVYYNMQGQRVASPSHGIYIVNGKKVIMK